MKNKNEKSKELGKKNEKKEFKRNDYRLSSKIIAKEITIRAKLNKADIYLKLKNNSLEEPKIIFKRAIQYLTNKDFTSNQSTRNIIGIDDLSKDELIQKKILSLEV